MEFAMKLVNSFRPSADAFIFMWAILIAAIFTISIIIERMWYISSRAGSKPEEFIKRILDLIKNNDIPGAVSLCAKAPKMALAQVVKAGLNEAGAAPARIQNTVDAALLKMIPELEKRTGFLAVIGNVSTLLGLLGTVFGLIMSFAAVGKPGIDAVQKSELLAQGIATAMNATFCGLTVAICAIVIYAYLKAKTQGIVDELDEFSLRLKDALIEKFLKK
jgi:biopolymer transport protein ExbB/TolQ